MKKLFQQLFIPPQSSLRETITIIGHGAAQIALVVDKQQRLLGTVTDGDIRRGLLRGETLESPVERVMHREFHWVPEGTKEAQVLEMMRREVLHQIPVRDKQGRVVWLFLLEDLLQPKTLPNRVVLMVGGKGMRLRPMTENCPKPMLPIQGKPMLEIIIERCKEAGFRHFYLAVNYLKEQIVDHFGYGSRWGVCIEYLEESEPLGTAGALSLLPEPPEHPLLVLNGDVLTLVPFAALLRFHEENNSMATLCVREHETIIPFGVVQTAGTQVISLEEKPTLIHYVNAGVYVLSPEVLSHLSRNTACDMPTLIERFQQKQLSVHAFPIHEYWLDVGHPETLERARGDW